MCFVQRSEHLVVLHAFPGQNPTMRRFPKDHTQLESITFLDSEQPLAISTQSRADAPVDVEVRPPNLPIGVRELWHTLQRHPQPPVRQNPSFLLKVFVPVEDDEA